MMSTDQPRRTRARITFVRGFIFYCLQPPLGHSGSRGGSSGIGRHLWFSCSKHGRLGQAAGQRSQALGRVTGVNERQGKPNQQLAGTSVKPLAKT